MQDISEIVLEPEDEVKLAIAILDRHPARIVLIVSPEHELLGTVTDGDIRRAILNGMPFDAPVSRVMNSKPTTANLLDDK